MNPFKFFNKNRYPKFELVASSDNPYVVGINDEEEIPVYKTFTDNLDIQQEGKINSLPLKVGYDTENLYQISLYIPDNCGFIELMKNIQGEYLMSLWMFLDNEEFLINIPVEYIIHEGQNVIQVILELKNTGFHSEKKRICDSMNPEEINKFVLDLLTNHNIEELWLRIIQNNDDDDERKMTSFILSSTKERIAKAVKAIAKKVKA